MALFNRKKTATSAATAKRGRTAKRERMRSVAPRVVLVIAAVVVCAVPPIFLDDVVGYLPLLALLLTLGLSFAYLQVLKRSFTYSEESLVPSCERGSEIDFVLTFENKSFLPFLRLEPYIYISDLFDDVDTITPVSMPLMPFEKRDFTFTAQFDHIGTYSAGVKKIVISDLLGLFTHTIENPNRHRVEVLPRIAQIEELPLTSTASSDSQKPLQTLVTDDLDYAGVRAYQWGDPIKTIHWKLSSRLEDGEYLTRLFESFNNPGINIIIDTTSPSYDNESLMFVFDGVIEGALSINAYARAAGLDSFISFYDKYSDECRMRIADYRDFTELTDELPRISVGDCDQALELLRREGNSIHGQDNIAFCSAHASEAVINALCELKLRKRNPLFLLALPPSLEGDELKERLRPLRRLDAAQISYFALTPVRSGEEGRGA